MGGENVWWVSWSEVHPVVTVRVRAEEKRKPRAPVGGRWERGCQRKWWAAKRTWLRENFGVGIGSEAWSAYSWA